MAKLNWEKANQDQNLAKYPKPYEKVTNKKKKKSSNYSVKSMKSRFDGTCSGCRTGYKRGELITLVKSTKEHFHKMCYKQSSMFHRNERRKKESLVKKQSLSIPEDAICFLCQTKSNNFDGILVAMNGNSRYIHELCKKSALIS